MTDTEKEYLLNLIDNWELAERPRVGRGHVASTRTRMRPVNISLPPDIVARLGKINAKSHLIERLLSFYFMLVDDSARPKQ